MERLLFSEKNVGMLSNALMKRMDIKATQNNYGLCKNIVTYRLKTLYTKYRDKKPPNITQVQFGKQLCIKTVDDCATKMMQARQVKQVKQVGQNTNGVLMPQYGDRIATLQEKPSPDDLEDIMNRRLAEYSPRNKMSMQSVSKAQNMPNSSNLPKQENDSKLQNLFADFGDSDFTLLNDLKDNMGNWEGGLGISSISPDEIKKFDSNTNVNTNDALKRLENDRQNFDSGLTSTQKNAKFDPSIPINQPFLNIPSGREGHNYEILAAKISTTGDMSLIKDLSSKEIDIIISLLKKLHRDVVYVDMKQKKTDICINDEYYTCQNIDLTMPIKDVTTIRVNHLDTIRYFDFKIKINDEVICISVPLYGSANNTVGAVNRELMAKKLPISIVYRNDRHIIIESSNDFTMYNEDNSILKFFGFVDAIYENDNVYISDNRYYNAKYEIKMLLNDNININIALPVIEPTEIKVDKIDVHKVAIGEQSDAIACNIKFI